VTAAGAPSSLGSPDEDPVTVRDLLAETAFVRFQLVRLASVVSIQVLSVVVGYQTWERTEDPSALGWIGGAQFLPMLALIFVSGEVADRFNRKTILQLCHVGIAGVAGALIAWSRTPGTELLGSPMAGAYLALFVFGSLRAFAGPAGQALVPSLVPVKLYPRAVAVSATTFQVAIVTGPALGGLLYGAFGAEVAYGLAAALQLLAAAVLFSVRPPLEPRRIAEGRMIDRLLGGLRYVKERPIILGAISLDLFAVLLGGAVALMPIYARDILDVGAEGLGVLRSAPAIGAGVVAVFLGVRPLGKRAGPILFFCVGLFGAATIVFGLSTNLLLSIAALVVLGAADMVSVVVRQVVVQGTTPPEMRGRVAAVNLLFISASNELGELESGFLAGAIGPVEAVVLGGVLSIVVTVLWAFLFPSLRRFGSEPVEEARRA
jgi:MFS family permease